MKSKIERAILHMIIEGKTLSKFDISKTHGCLAKSAQRVLNSMHKDKLIRIHAWIKSGDRNVPVYMAGGGKDVPPPKAKTNAERCKKKYRADPEIYMAKQRAKRLVQKIKEKKIGFETNPYGELYRIAVQRSDRVCD